MRILYVEPFEGGSHAAFTRVLTSALPAQWTKVTLPGRHWKWRMRGSAVHAFLEREAELGGEYDLLFASSYLPLAELVGLCPKLAKRPRLLYFHENQLAYPRQPGPGVERDHHYGFTQLVSALAATRCLFNSQYNLESFLRAGEALLARMPDAVPRDWIPRIEARSEVLPVPLDLPDEAPSLKDPSADERALGPIILWNHRWEFDKNPAGFFAALRRLAERDVAFRVAVCGEQFKRVPPEFQNARTWLGERIEHFGFVADRQAYTDLLSRAHIVVSTAQHEFFGVAVLEATHFGARPLVPRRLAYPEIFPDPDLYDTDEELVARLEQMCRDYCAGRDELRADRRGLTAGFTAAAVVPRFARCFDSVVLGAEAAAQGSKTV